MVDEKFYSPDAVGLTGKDLFLADRHVWIGSQIKLIRGGKLRYLDSENLIDILKDVVRRDRQVLENAFTRLFRLIFWSCLHLSLDNAKAIWAQIEIEQKDIARLLDIMKSLKSFVKPALDAAFLKARKEIIAEERLPDNILPFACNWSYEELLALGPYEVVAAFAETTDSKALWKWKRIPGLKQEQEQEQD